jgi:hypothetical protein
MRFMRSAPSPVMIVAALALVLALAGTAIAAPDIATKKVTKSEVKKIAKKQAKKQIRKKAPGLSVLHADSADEASPTGPAGGDLNGNYPNPVIGDQKVTTDKIADLAVTNPKLADDSVDALKIAADAVGSSEIAAGAVRASELGGTQLATQQVGIAANGNGVAAVACPAGTRVLSGGGTSSSFNIHMVTSFQAGNGWIVAYQNTAAAAGNITAIATCLSV